MEVVSPLTFSRSNQGGKRRFAYSPLHDVAVNIAAVAGVPDPSDDFDMSDDPSNFGYQAPKRRKKYSSDCGDSTSFLPMTASSTAPSPFAMARSNQNGASFKRSRISTPDESSSSPLLAQQKFIEIQRVVEKQASEIERLKAEKESSKTSLVTFSAQHVKMENENRILKRAVTIQQERQNHMSSELEGARRYKEEADERIRRLEQMNLTLQYQLQAHSTPAGNDFMGFNHQPPDVY